MANNQNGQTQQTPVGTKKISIYLTVIVVIVIALSIVALIIAGAIYLANPTNSQELLVAAFFAFIGLIALTMSMFTLYQSQRQAKEMKIETPKVMTIIGCTNKNCDSKTSREFQRGDYVYKELDTPCPKCGGKQMIVGIYKEVKEKEKTYNV